MKDIVLNFIDYFDLKNDKNVMGIIFYGSYLWGNFYKNSDIDLHIITYGGVDKKVRKRFKGNIFECFYRKLENVYNLLNYDFENNRTMIFSMLGHGKILFDRDGLVCKLQQDILNKYENFNFKKIDEDSYKREILDIYGDLDRLKMLQEENSQYFYTFYYLTLDEIRKLYQKANGLSQDISRSKVYKFYTDKQYNNYKFKKLPDDNFINKYLDAIKLESTDKMMENIRFLFELLDLKLIGDFDNCEVYIK